MAKEKDDKFPSLKKARAALDKKQKRHSSDEHPHYIGFKHADNLFEIDYPAHWKVQKEKDGSVEFFSIDEQPYAGIMFFKTPLQIDSTLIEQSGKWEMIAEAMLAQVGSTNLRYDPTIIYSNFTADRPEPDQAGQRWFVLCSDLILGISTNCSHETKEKYSPIFERMLSSLRVHRDDELLAVQILNRVHHALVERLPGRKIEVRGLTIVTDQFELSIGNILAQVKRNPNYRDSIIEHFVQGMVGLTGANEQIGKETWATVSERIQPLLKSDKYIQEANQKTSRKNSASNEDSAFLISAPWLTDLRICFAIDNQDTFRFVNNLDMERWNVSLETLLEVAGQNLEKLPAPELCVMKPNSESPGLAAVQPSGSAASSYLLYSKLFQIASQSLGKDIVAAVPSRDVLMLFEYRGDKSSIQQAVLHDFSTSNHPLSDRLFRVTPDGIALL